MVGIGVAAAAGWGLTGAVFFIFLCIWLDLALELSSVMRLATLLSTALIFVGMAAECIRGTLKRARPE